MKREGSESQACSRARDIRTPPRGRRRTLRPPAEDGQPVSRAGPALLLPHSDPEGAPEGSEEGGAAVPGSPEAWFCGREMDLHDYPGVTPWDLGEVPHSERQGPWRPGEASARDLVGRAPGGRALCRATALSPKTAPPLGASRGWSRLASRCPLSVFIHQSVSPFIYSHSQSIPHGTARGILIKPVCPSPSCPQPCQAPPSSQSETSPPRNPHSPTTSLVTSPASAPPGLPVTHVAPGLLLPRGLCTAVPSARLLFPRCLGRSIRFSSARFRPVAAFPTSLFTPPRGSLPGAGAALYRECHCPTGWPRCRVPCGQGSSLAAPG